MEKEVKKFVYHKNNWPLPKEKKNPNIRGEKIGTLWLDGQFFAKGNFALLQAKRRDYCKTYGISKERANKRFKITY